MHVFAKLSHPAPLRDVFFSPSFDLQSLLYSHLTREHLNEVWIDAFEYTWIFPRQKSNWTEPPFGAMTGLESHFCDGSWLTFSPTTWVSEDCDRRRSEVSYTLNNLSTCHRNSVANQMRVLIQQKVYHICPRVKMAAQLHTFKQLY